MFVQTPDARILEQNAAATIWLQPMLVRIDGNGIRFADGRERVARARFQIVHQRKISAVRSIRVNSKFLIRPQPQNFLQRINRSRRGRSQRRHHRRHAAAPQPRLQSMHVHAPARVAGHRFERQLQTPC